MSAIQDIFRGYFMEYVDTYQFTYQQSKVVENIIYCKTKEMGQSTYACETCEDTAVSYHSCRNRHCPTCQGVTKEVWIDKRNKDVLNAPYFHVVFTMPKQLHRLIYHNQKVLYDLMYKAVAETLTELAADKKYLGAQIGFFSVLHTWGQNLFYHPHIHTVVLAGGLTKDNKWRKTSNKFFIPVKVLSKKFRGKYMHYLKEYFKKGKLKFLNDMEKNEDPKLFQKLVNDCYNLDWYSYTKKTFKGPLAVMKYLGRYTHRIAISNQRIQSIDLENDTVSIGVKDYKNNNQKKIVTLETIEFIRRFLMHVLPKGFVKIRHYGILANRNRNTKLQLCRKLTRSPLYKSKFEGLTKTEIISLLIGKDVTKCPSCKKGHLKLVEEDTS
ncbi:IS91 family transposase [Bacillus alkalicola]|uniref:IS91 family transposase n=1 Tax=Evansella alkalicola TaxID=745819 RepID=A0ABS6JVV0_9BACI|nr:IS91 family transposase [Bacillus alkalicola]MBU9722724.1 IS91 family transposase [Bacillus alkalicola]MBU9722766.1 IS91 family transposase [Bacillus alkalicola]MBU9724242.1 IS91 family transposase [Bacillus alkalicola]MBU9724244.1 IS91 family transposase [Bacillus alkalicola]